MRKCCIPVTKTTNLHRLFHRYSISHAVQLQFKSKLMDTVHYQVLFNLMHTYSNAPISNMQAFPKYQIKNNNLIVIKLPERTVWHIFKI